MKPTNEIKATLKLEHLAGYLPCGLNDSSFSAFHKGKTINVPNQLQLFQKLNE